MTTLTIKIPDDAENKFSAMLKELGGEILQKSNLSKTAEQKEVDFFKQIELGLKDVADIKAGKIKRISLAEGLNG